MSSSISYSSPLHFCGTLVRHLLPSAARMQAHLLYKTPNSATSDFRGRFWLGRPAAGILHSSFKQLEAAAPGAINSSKVGTQSLVHHEEPTTALMEVTLREASMVKPLMGAEESNVSYFLSNFDIPMAPLIMEPVMFFPGDANRRDDPAKVMKEALERVLVHYYPVAGRLARDSAEGRPFVVCNGEGVWFAVADANIEIAGLGDLHLPNNATDLARLLYPLSSLDQRDSRPLLTAQVTRFRCGGFALGVMFTHCLFDGSGFCNFLNAWAETARGVPLSSLPVLDRTLLKARQPLQVNYSHTEYTEIEDLTTNCSASSPRQNNNTTAAGVLRSFRFAPSNLEALRKKALEDGVLSACSTFEALSGLLWKARSTAVLMSSSLCVKPEQRMKLLVGFDGRMAKGAGRIPKGYLGNGVTLTAAIASAGELQEKPLSYAVKHAQDAVKRMTGDYIRSQLDYLEREGPAAGLPSLTATVGLSYLGRMSVYNLDFGWGKLTHLAPAVRLPVPQAVFILAYGEGWKGMNVLLYHSPDVMQKIDEFLLPYILNPVE